MNDRNSSSDIFKKVELFLKQQRELYGEETYLPGESDSGNAISMAGTRMPDGSDKKTEQEASPLQKPKTIRVTEDLGLFEGAVLNKEWKIDSSWYDSASLNELDSRINKCQKCALGLTRRNFVFGVGDPKAKLVFIGEAPGADEDEQGEPFVGRAGQLLNKILAAVQLRREDVYICNILKCRPPNNRDPLPEEIDACEPYLKKQLEIIKPKLIVCLGRIAGQSLLRINTSLAEFRNNIYEYQGIKVLVTYHPAALLRNPNWKRPAWEDFQKMRKLYDELSSANRE